MEDNGPQGVASLKPRGMIWLDYVGDHKTLLYIKYISCGHEGYILKPAETLWLVLLR